MTSYPVQEAFHDSSQVQVCRVCQHVGDRYWRVPIMERVTLRKKGETVPQCEPTDDLARVHAVKIIPADQYARPEIKLVADTEDLRATNQSSSVRSYATVVTCGQVIANNCKNCRNFVPMSVNVPIQIAGVERPRPLMVAGHCGLPEEGINVDGKMVQCDYQPKVNADYEPSCANCAFRESSAIFDDFDRDPAKLDLDAYERFILQRDLRASQPENPGAFYNQRRHEILTHPSGVYFTFAGDLLEWDGQASHGCDLTIPHHMHDQARDLTARSSVEPLAAHTLFDGTIIHPVNPRAIASARWYANVDAHSCHGTHRNADNRATRYKVDFGKNRIHWISEDDDGVDRIDLVANNRVVVTFLGVHGVIRCGLVIKNAIRRPVLGELDVTRVRYDVMAFSEEGQELVHPDCTDCQRNNHGTRGLSRGGPCYFHAKDIAWDEQTQTHTARHPGLTRTVYEDTPIRNLQIVRQGAILSVVDGNGQVPHPVAFMAALPDLRRQCVDEGEVRQLMRALSRCLARNRTRTSSFEVGYGAPLSNAEFAKSHCALNQEHRVTFVRSDGVRVTSINPGGSLQAAGNVDGPDHDGARDRRNGAPVLTDVHGINFRRIFGDTFGQPREENDHSWSFQMESEALRYAGITPSSRSEREFSTQRLQEEMLVNDVTYHEAYGSFERHLAELEDTGEPIEWRTLRYDSLAHRGDDVIEDVEDLSDDFAAEDRKAYTEWLNLYVEQPLVEITVHDADTGKHIITRRESTVHFTNRFAQHGYDIMRYARAKRASVRAEGVLTPEDVFTLQDRSHRDVEDFERNSGWYCLACEKHYAFDDPQISDALVCTCGGALVLRDFDAQYKYLPNPGRGQDGTRTVLLKDQPGYQETARLLDMVCSGWVRRNSNPMRPITLRSLRRDVEVVPQRWSWNRAMQGQWAWPPTR